MFGVPDVFRNDDATRVRYSKTADPTGEGRCWNPTSGSGSLDSVRDGGAAVPSCPSHDAVGGLFLISRSFETRRGPNGSLMESEITRVAHRSNLVFTSFTMGLFCCVVAEFSRGRSVELQLWDDCRHVLWQYFGTYIWFVIIGLRPLGQFLCAIVEEQLQEAPLVMPVMTVPTRHDVPRV